MAPPRKCDCGVCKLCQRRVYLRNYYRRKQAEQSENGNGNGNGHVGRALTHADLNSARVRAWLREQIDARQRQRQESL